MIKNWYITGDTHGYVYSRIWHMIERYSFGSTDLMENNALIILGDVGLNFYLDKKEEKNKQRINDLHIWIYCLRGNHEERPENILTIQEIYDENVGNLVYYEPRFPYIRYFKDGEIYRINGHPTLTIGGAYSVDKYWRLENAGITENNPKVRELSGWFPDEQLTQKEMEQISTNVKNRQVDLVFSHTCPLGWQPKDLFLPGLEKVDDSMERWLAGLSTQFDWKVWLFGHYHDDRIIMPRVEMLFTKIVPLEDIWNYWEKYDPYF